MFFAFNPTKSIAPKTTGEKRSLTTFSFLVNKNRLEAFQDSTKRFVFLENTKRSNFASQRTFFHFLKKSVVINKVVNRNFFYILFENRMQYPFKIYSVFHSV